MHQQHDEEMVVMKQIHACTREEDGSFRQINMQERDKRKKKRGCKTIWCMLMKRDRERDREREGHNEYWAREREKKKKKRKERRKQSKRGREQKTDEDRSWWRLMIDVIWWMGKKHESDDEEDKERGMLNREKHLWERWSRRGVQNRGMSIETQRRSDKVKRQTYIDSLVYISIYVYVEREGLRPEPPFTGVFLGVFLDFSRFFGGLSADLQKDPFWDAFATSGPGRPGDSCKWRLGSQERERDTRESWRVCVSQSHFKRDSKLPGSASCRSRWTHLHATCLSRHRIARVWLI